jgi:cob(I)alamin adenosyltransferase
MESMKETGLVHIYCGDGKGKTTAAVGLAMRCVGAGGRVLFFQFLKGNTSSERNVIEKLGNIDVVSGIDNMKFVWTMTEDEKAETARRYREIFSELKKKAEAYDMLILDEVIPALKYDFISEGELIDFIASKPKNTELVLTGRNPSERLVGLADYVTEMKKIKHPFDRGVNARNGVEL